MIHPTAIIHPDAKVDPSVKVGPYAVIDGQVSVGPNCVIGPHVHLTGVTTIGTGNQFHTGCVIGDAPQDLRYKEEPTRVRIADNNVFREHVTVHRSSKLQEDTVIGSNNFLMAGSHVGHNCSVGNYVIIANGALLGGHVTVHDRAFISGNCLVHQFVRIGTMALMQGGSAISKDLPPFAIARGHNGMCGLNAVGMRRAGIAALERLELKRLYLLLFRSGKKLSVAIEEVRQEFVSPASKTMLEFVAGSKRGICADTSRRSSPTTESEAEP
ncbi:acyl-ACP--UDP-N-acetylglucosamine O-acyltransferase [Pedosphaera parvula]|uniref:Acyl-(Acyl-carrier-protein)--UDP-N-acetylglucosamine O-acyltransferase n=1 Tax=Pedosphaera parvula (strain Ellin514) TaxID=320771 RepID=B9XRT0_PEDPL|nr:acyl-ACP--UDP-N-acetylglucosamine O-acyltransferase [Pedosphaera parvula]EEF57441.1 acyl-(acyl-carrier-protein)--UDP-N-acetylglucosamine O-acyltransferase [Pedosphaera parvula Ellin514]